MNEELFDIYNLDGTKTGRIATMKEVKTERLAIKTAAVWFVNSNGQILLQQGGKQGHKSFGEWRLTVTGKTDAGETTLDTAQRETFEELGLNIPKDQFKLIQTLLYNDFPDYPYFCDIYVVFIDFEASEIKIDKAEVADLKWFDRDYLINWEQNNMHVNKKYFSLRLNNLLEWLDKNGSKK
ncbi:MAG: NUDIX domain-containing protein [Alphaproteobacteria bacterium]|nr:NUDIX domain-containing protein [Alphaproteobacteria bacterium]